MPSAPPPTATTSLAEIALLIGACADPTRLRLLNLLAAGELCVCDLVELLAQPQSTVSRHLGHLHRAQLVTVSREWKFAHYRLADAISSAHGRLLHGLLASLAEVPRLQEERLRAATRAAERADRPC